MTIKKELMKKSAGILFYRLPRNELEVLLVHMGGPFWKNKDAGAWTIPKGEIEEGESPLDAAIREVEEETGIKASGKFIELHPITQKAGKIIYAWGLQKDLDLDKIRSNTFEMEWPPKSGLKKSFPEIDKAEWFTVSQASLKIVSGQIELIKELALRLGKKVT